MGQTSSQSLENVQILTEGQVQVGILYSWEIRINDLTPEQLQQIKKATAKAIQSDNNNIMPTFLEMIDVSNGTPETVDFRASTKTLEKLEPAEKEEAQAPTDDLIEKFPPGIQFLNAQQKDANSFVIRLFRE